jgi:hypothetical protein
MSHFCCSNERMSRATSEKGLGRTLLLLFSAANLCDHMTLIGSFSKYHVVHSNYKKNDRYTGTDPEVYYYTSGTLNALHGTIGTLNGMLNSLHRTIETVKGTLNGLHVTLKIFHLYGDVTINGEGLQNRPNYSAFRAFKQGGIFIHHATPAVTRDLDFSGGPPHSVASYDT